MKIIFDSEEQKMAMIGVLSGAACPNALYLKETSNCVKTHISCRKCWENSCIEMEVERND